MRMAQSSTGTFGFRSAIFVYDGICEPNTSRRYRHWSGQIGPPDTSRVCRGPGRAGTTRPGPGGSAGGDRAAADVGAQAGFWNAAAYYSGAAGIVGLGAGSV